MLVPQEEISLLGFGHFLNIAWQMIEQPSLNSVLTQLQAVGAGLGDLQKSFPFWI